MSKNCFVTKLKGVVSDNTLSRFGELPIKVVAGSFQINNSTSDTLVRSDKASLSLVNGGPGANSVTVPKAANTTTNTTVYITTDCTIFLPQYELNRFYFLPAADLNIKYVGGSLEEGAYISITASSVSVHLGSLPINARSIANSMCTFDFDSDEYPYLITINSNLSNRVWVVNAEELAEKLPAIREYTLWSTAANSTGTFDDFGVCTGLTSFKGFHGSGTIEGFVAKQRAASRTTGSVTLQYLGAVTFNGSTINSGTAKTLSWTANTITFDGTTINA